MSIISDKDIIMYQAVEAIASIGNDAAELYDKGFPEDEEIDQAFKAILIIQGLQMQNDLKDYEIETMLGCLMDITEIDDIPLSVPLINNTEKPQVVDGSAFIGPPGPRGMDGSDATVDVDSEVPDILIQEVEIGGVKTFKLIDNTYIPPTINVSISGSKIHEIGSLPDIQFTIQSTIGRDAVTARTILSPAGFSLVNAAFDDTEIFTDVDVAATTVYSAEITDGTTLVSDSETVNLYYPFLWGLTDGTSITHYSALTKDISAKSDKVYNFQTGGDIKYFWIAYPSSYGDLSIIKDKNGFDVTSGWQKSVVNISSSGLPADWTHEYNVYRIISSTDVSGNITFEF